MHAISKCLLFLKFSFDIRSVEETLESIRSGKLSPNDLPPIQVSSSCLQVIVNGKSSLRSQYLMVVFHGR